MPYKATKDPRALLKMLSEHEQAIAQLYQTYSGCFENYADFWANLAQEERKHADCLDKLSRIVQEDPAVVIVERFSIDAIRFSINYVNELIERANQPDFKLINAMSLAAKLEEALLEKNFFEVLEGGGQEIRQTLEFLRHETDRHSQVLNHALKDYKNSIGLQ